MRLQEKIKVSNSGFSLYVWTGSIFRTLIKLHHLLMNLGVSKLVVTVKGGRGQERGNTRHLLVSGGSSESPTESTGSRHVLGLSRLGKLTGNTTKTLSQSLRTRVEELRFLYLNSPISK